MKRYPSEILATCVIPWHSDYSFDEELFKAQVRLLRESLTRRLYLFGTAGEGYAVSNEQFEHIVRVFHSEMNTELDHPMVGIISLSLPTIIERIEFCRSVGIHDFQISLPSWGTLTDREVDIFFAATCGRFPDCNFLHYNLQRTGRVLRGVDYARLSAAHTNLVAVKYGGDDNEIRLDILQQAPLLQCFFMEGGYVDLRDKFECGLLLSIAVVNPNMAKVFFNARGPEQVKLLSELQRARRIFHKAVAGAGHMDGVFDKVYIKALLPNFPLRLLPPYTFANDDCVTALIDGLPSHWKPPTIHSNVN